MNGPQHYAEGDRLLANYPACGSTSNETGLTPAEHIALAQAHYTAALVAATLDATEVSHEKFSSGTRYEQPIEIRNWREVTA